MTPDLEFFEDIKAYGITVDGIRSVRRGLFTSTQKMFSIKEDVEIDDGYWASVSATHLSSAWSFKVVKANAKEWQDLEWDPTITF